MTNGPAPDTAMATGNDEGEAGERGVDDRPLDAAERSLLAGLADRGPAATVDAVEDSPAAQRAVDDGTVLPVPAPPVADDGLAPPFQEPPAG